MPVLRKRAFTNQDKIMQNGLYVHSSPPRVLQLSSAYIKQLIRSGDIDKLEQVVLEGQGKKLVGEYSADYKVRTFLKNVPSLMSKLNQLHDAVNSGRLEELQSLLDEEPEKKKKYVLSKDEAGVGLLHKAVYYDLPEISKWLIENFPHVVSVKDSEGRTAYHYSPMCRNPSEIQDLLKSSGADPSVLDHRQHSAKYYMNNSAELELPSLHKSLSNSRKSTATRDSLAFKKSNIRIWIHQRNLGHLQKVVWEGHGSKLLVEHSNNPKIKKFLEAVPHIMALIKDVHTDVINDDLQGLKDHMAPVPSLVLSGKDANGLTPLHKAAGLGKQEIVEYITETYPNGLNTVDNEGRTPLHYSALPKDGGKIFDYLIQAGADESVLDNKQKTAAFYKTRSNEIDPKVLQVIPECPRLAKDSFPANWDWNALVSSLPSEDVIKAVKKADALFGVTTEKDNNSNEKEELKTDSNGIHENGVNNNEDESRSEALEEVNNNDVSQSEANGNDDDSGVNVNYEPEPEIETDTQIDLEPSTEQSETVPQPEPGPMQAEHEDKEEEMEIDQQPMPESEVEPEEKEEEQNIERPESVAKTIPEPDDDEKENPDANEQNDSNETEVDEVFPELRAPSRVSLANQEDVEKLLDETEAEELKNEDISPRPPSNTLQNIEGNDLTNGNSELDSVDDNEGVIEGVVNGENEIESLNEEGRGATTETNNDPEVRALVESGNMEQLAALVLNGDGEKLVGQQSDSPELQSFLDNVSVYMEKINRIHIAARDGSLKDLQAALDRRKFAIAKDKISPNGASPLHVATIFGNTSIVRYLAGRFPETVQMADDNGRTPLHYAATVADNGHYYNLLLHLGANNKVEDKFGKTPDYYRTNQDGFSHKTLLNEFDASEEVMEEMLGDKDNPNGQVDMPFFCTEEGRYLASSLGDPLIKGLTEVASKRPPDPIAYLATYLYNFANSGNKSRGKTAETQGLVSEPPEGANTNVPASIEVVTVEPNDNQPEEDSAFSSTSRDEHGQSMLHFAAARSHGRNALFQLLLETDINIGYRDELYRTARDISIQANIAENTMEIDRYVMHIASKGDTDKLVELLLDGYDHIIDIVDEENTPILEAIENKNQPETVAFLQSILAFEERRERVHHAIRQGTLNEIKQLLADENDTGSGKLLAIGKNSYGRCTLHIAVLCQQEEIVDFIASSFPETLRIGDNLGRTALHYAMGIEKIESISRVLVKAGARRVVKDLKGRQPTYYFMNKADILRLQEEEETF